MSRRDRIELGTLGLMVAVILVFVWSKDIFTLAFSILSISLFAIGVFFTYWRQLIRFHLAVFFLPFSAPVGLMLIIFAIIGDFFSSVETEHSFLEYTERLIKPSFVLAVILTSVPLAYLSGSGGSAGGWTDQLREWFNFTPDQADLAVRMIRKTIHFCAYGTIAMTAYLATRSIQKGKSAIIVALVWGCAHGAFDELRQAQTPGRQGRVEDFMVDLAGMIVFLAVTHWLCNNRDKTAINES